MITVDLGSKLAPTWFKSTKDKSGEVEWLLKPLSGLEFMQVQSGASVNSEGNFCYSWSSIQAALKFAIKDFKGFSDKNGTPLEYGFYILDSLPSEVLMEVHSEIMNRAYIREYERKNSSSQ